MSLTPSTGEMASAAWPTVTLSFSSAADIIFIALIALAALSDIETRKVSNSLNFTLLLTGLGASALSLIEPTIGHVGPLRSIAGVAVALAVLIFPFAWRVYQGGDVKLCMGMGAWLGVDGALRAIGFGVLMGGFTGLVIVAARLLSRRSAQDDVISQTKSDQEPFTIPMAVCFSSAGAWVYLGLPLFW